MSSFINIVEDLLSEGINVVPVKQDKRPMVEWTTLKSRMMTIEVAEQFFSGMAWGVAVVCGKISGSLEVIDFDAHDGDIEAIYNEWKSDEGVADILNRHKVYIERSMRGGLHFIYRFDASGQHPGNTVLARWEDGTTMIETRGEGGYVIISPSPGYEVLHGDLCDLSELSYDEREYLVSHARNFNRKTTTATEHQGDDNGFDFTDPVSWFNWHKAYYTKMILKDKGWTMIDVKDNVEQWRRPGKSDGISATWSHKYNAFYMFTNSWDQLTPQVYYTPFQLLVRLRFRGDYMAALHWIVNKYFDATDQMPYIRIGTDYYKRIKKVDRFGIDRTELKPWKKDEIKQDHGKEIFNNIPRFDDFDIEPNNFDYTPIIRNCYNLYKEFPHKPEPGSWKWSKILMEHVFGDQYEIGLRYLQALYIYPKRMLPILVLVSRERQTGKTTFINWLNMIFGPNMTNINPEDLTSSFNSAYATSNIIAVEETLIEKSITVEKLKALATGKFLSVNQKYVSPYKVPFFGKIILASNNEEKFARIDEEEIRFFVRKLTKPKFTNHDIESDLIREIPAFLHYLTSLPEIDWTRDRSGFTPDELANEQLQQVKHESKSALYKDLIYLFTDLFNNHPDGVNEVQFTPTDIKAMWFNNNSRIDIQYIAYVLKNDFKLEPGAVVRYLPFGLSFDEKGLINKKRVGAPYTLMRSDFTTEKIQKVQNYVGEDGLPW